ncbi:MAG: type III PLP-dependent enzyme [Pseudomonadota bacterium]|nr:type III PLP-dependent enzyme [Pseudomonadota bacterium]
MTDKIKKFLAKENPETPCLIVDLERITSSYNALCRNLPQAEIFYAVKANPATPVLKTLLALGSSFDAASIYEIEACLGTGVTADKITFGNTVKKTRDIARAFELGINLFAFDSRAELSKLKCHAPGAKVYCRLFMEDGGAAWPLSRKFGCEPNIAIELLAEAALEGMEPAGVSFHVGSQQLNLSQWELAISRTAKVFEELNKKNIQLELLNIGGGFPAHYRQSIESIEAYGNVIQNALKRHFKNSIPRIIAEPGRGIVGDAGIIQAEVILIAKKSRETRRRWVFLDIGKFGGLPETFEEAIQYRITTGKDGEPFGPVVLAGPTCDEVDVLYDKSGYSLPLGLIAGDKIEFLSAGAYTASYSSVCFNGFPPLTEYYI